MAEILQYAHKDAFLHRLHPYTKIAFIIIVSIMCIIATDLVFLTLMVLAMLAVAAYSRLLAELLQQLKLIIVMSAIFILITVITIPNGEILGYIIPQGIPVIGGFIPVTAGGLTIGIVLTLRFMVEKAFSETHLLVSLSALSKPTAEQVVPAVSAAGLLLSAGPPGTQAVRKDVAYFIWGIVSRAEHDPKLLGKYRAKYAASPVPDVPIDAPWFDAALGVVERELMDLPDGVNFQPDGPVTGLQYLEILGKLARQYG